MNYLIEKRFRQRRSRYNECCLDAEVFSSKDNSKGLLGIIDHLQAVK